MLLLLIYIFAVRRRRPPRGKGKESRITNTRLSHRVPKQKHLTMKSTISIASLVILCVAVFIKPLDAFTIKPSHTVVASTAAHNLARSALPSRSHSTAVSKVTAVTADLDIVGLVAGQENYGFALVALCEAIWSFAQAPSFSHAIVLAPASIAAVVLVAVSGPMVTSGDAGSVALGLEIATGVSTLLGAR